MTHRRGERENESAWETLFVQEINCKAAQEERVAFKIGGGEGH